MEYNNKTDLPKPPLHDSKWYIFKRKRYLVSFLAFFGFMNMYAIRVNLSVAIVAMTSEQLSVVKLENGTTISAMVQEFDWDSKLRGMVLGSFFYGYISTQILGAYLSRRFGGARLFGIGVAASALFTLITPPLARLNVYFLVALRILEGMFQGVTFPCLDAVWSQWAPPMERTQLASIATSGIYVGLVVTNPICGILAQILGWAADFYVTGLIALFWSIIWFWVVKDRPEDDPHISTEEMNYIHASLSGSSSDSKMSVPWRSILTSMPVWAIAVAMFTEDLGFYTLLMQLPTFMKEMLNFDLAEAGLLSALPYVGSSLMMQIAGFFIDWVRASYLTTKHARKFFLCTAFTCQAICIFIVSYMSTSVGVVLCLIISCSVAAFAISSYGVNNLDIAPQYASILKGLDNTFSQLAGVISPTLAGYLVQHKHEASEWKNMFLITSCVYIFGAIFYGIFGDGEVQSWVKNEARLLRGKNEPKETEKQEAEV
nr:PREDICTED: sialin-like [Bemisia tabaci]